MGMTTLCQQVLRPVKGRKSYSSSSSYSSSKKRCYHPYEAKTERCDQSWERRCISALRRAFEDEDDDEYDLKPLTASPQPVRPHPHTANRELVIK
jgi:hypothetical protein